jgi:hypothetical protein
VNYLQNIATTPETPQLRATSARPGPAHAATAMKITSAAAQDRARQRRTRLPPTWQQRQRTAKPERQASRTPEPDGLPARPQLHRMSVMDGVSQ